MFHWEIYININFEDLHTVIVEIEGTINKQPLICLYDDMQGISQPLTPAHMIYSKWMSFWNYQPQQFIYQVSKIPIPDTE